MHKTPFEQELEVALQNIDFGLGNPEYRQDILLARDVEEAGNPFLALVREIAKSDKSVQTKFCLSALSPTYAEENGVTAYLTVRRRSKNIDGAIVKYEIALASEDKERKKKLDSADETELEEIIREAINSGHIHEAFDVYNPRRLINQEKLDRRQKIAAKFLASVKENIIKVDSYSTRGEGIVDITIGKTEFLDQPYNPKEMVNQVVKALCDYRRNK